MRKGRGLGYAVINVREYFCWWNPTFSLMSTQENSFDLAVVAREDTERYALLISNQYIQLK
jgi:hypothetical protein